MKRTLSLSALTLLCILIISASCTLKSSKPARRLQEYPLRFAVLGDRTGGHQPGIFPQIVTETGRMKPDFVLTVGDMIEGYGNDTLRIKQEWEEYKSLLEPLTMPVYFTSGNHDIWDSTSLGLYRRYIGEPYHSFSTKGIHFICLDNSRYATVDSFPEEQMEWLIDDLERNKDALYKFVFIHIPYWIKTIARGKPDTLHSIFLRYRVDAVFTGHYHDYFSGTFDDIVYTSLGSSGGQTSPGPTGLKYHFVWVTVDRDGVSIAPVKMDAVLPWDEVSAEEYIFTRKAKYQAIRCEKVPVGEDLKVPLTDVALAITNFSDSLTIEDTLHWDVPTGWTVNPTLLPVEIEPLNTYTSNFTVKSTGNLYPTPTASVMYPYARGKKFDIEHTLQVSRTVYAYETTTPAVIDGKLKEAMWKHQVTGLFAPDGSGTSTTDPVSFYFAWDEKNLYLGAKCVERQMDSIVATATEHDGAVYAEDCIGYFFQPDVDDGPIYQIYFNPLGVAFDQKILVEEKTPVAVERDWNGTYEVKTFRGNDHWSIETRIPLEQLSAEGRSGETWGINFRRKQKRLNTSADWLVPTGYDPETYGILIMK